MIAVLLERGDITAAEIWLYARVVEDAVETFLARTFLDLRPPPVPSIQFRRAACLAAV